jgi:hypothetical protein
MNDVAFNRLMLVHGVAALLIAFYIVAKGTFIPWILIPLTFQFWMLVFVIIFILAGFFWVIERIAPLTRWKWLIRMVCAGPIIYPANDLARVRSEAGFTEFKGYLDIQWDRYKVYESTDESNWIHIWLEEDTEHEPHGRFMIDTNRRLRSQLYQDKNPPSTEPPNLQN